MATSLSLARFAYVSSTHFSTVKRCAKRDFTALKFNFVFLKALAYVIAYAMQDFENVPSIRRERGGQGAVAKQIMSLSRALIQLRQSIMSPPSVI